MNSSSKCQPVKVGDISQIGHHYCETRPTYAQLAAVAERAEHAAKNACQDLREAVARSQAVPSYDVLAGLARADEWTVDEWEIRNEKRY